MSTQRREDRSIPATKICRGGPEPLQRTSCTDARESKGFNPWPQCAARLYAGQRGTVPPRSSACPHRQNIVAGDQGTAGHKLSAIGLPYRKLVQIVRQDFRLGSPPFRVALAEQPVHQRLTGHPSAHSLPCIDARFHPTLPRFQQADAAGRKGTMAKRFVFPARRMRRGLQFLKTTNSRKSTTNAKMSTPLPDRFTTAA